MSIVLESTSATIRRNFWNGVWRVMKRKPSRMVGVVIILGFAFMGVFGPMFFPAQLPDNPDAITQPPSWEHWFGTDPQGRDVLALVITGSRYVLLSAAVTALITVVLGTALGLYSGFKRGRWDTVLMRITDMKLTIPGLPLLLVLATVWKFGNPVQMGLVLGLLGWGGVARAVRAQTLSCASAASSRRRAGSACPRRTSSARNCCPAWRPTSR
ncbi:ABC transporter permease [Nonomuraea recticatena]|uniref:ABC transporter permease n=1 Tax=Nonomuraea recticatena TaxID=46178 RepID=UPI003613AE15